MDIKEKIQKIIEQDRDSTLVLTDEGDNFITFSTRENGDVGEEMSSDIDYEDALRISRMLKKEFPNKIHTTIEEVDEWVMLTVEIL